MKNFSICFLLTTLVLTIIGCDLWITGSKKTGYKIEIETDRIGYADLQGIEAILKANNYEVMYRERTGGPRYPEEVHSWFTKIQKNEKKVIVDIMLFYVKEESYNVARHPLVTIQNWFKGGIVPEIKTEIDNISNIIYQELASKVGKENVSFKRFGDVVEKR